MQASFDPDATNSFQFSLDGSPRALQLAGNFAVFCSLKLKQHDSLHRFIGNRSEQLIATLGALGQHIGGHLMTIALVDPQITESGLPHHGAPASLLTLGISPLGRDLSGRNDGQQSPECVSILGLNPAFRESTAETVERTVRRILFVVAPPGLHVEFLPGKLLQPHANVPPQLFGRSVIPLGKLVDPACD